MTPFMFVCAIIYAIYLYGLVTGQINPIKGKKWGEKKGPKIPLDDDKKYNSFNETKCSDSKEM